MSMVIETLQRTTVVAATEDILVISNDVSKRSELEMDQDFGVRSVVDTGRETVIVRFAKHDEDNPFDWRPAKKWMVILPAILYSTSTDVNATSYDSGSPSMQADLHCSALAATAGLTSYLVLYAIVPLLVTPISEQFGRRGMMLISSVVFMLCYIPVAVAGDVWIVILFRGVQGAAASSGNSLVGGVVADVFAANTRGLPMTIFAFLVLAGQGLGAVIFGWVDMKLGFRWIAWINMIIAFLLTIAMYFILSETRGSKILEDRARRLTLQTGILHIADADGISSTTSGKAGVWQLMKTTVSRPMVFLATEPVVAAFATWAALLWGVVYLLYSSVPLVYAQYNFSSGETGMVFLSAIIGSFFGVFAALWQDRLYQRDAARTVLGMAPPESRLYAACASLAAGGLIVPISLFWFAWSGRREVHWIVPTIALAFFNFGIFPIYLATFSYLADSYEQYGSSAIAAQAFLRNIFAGVFPLFAQPMYVNLGYPQASTLLGALASAFSILPFLLMIYGPRIRSGGKVAKQIAWQQEKRAAEAVREAQV